ncbi:MAG TPA: hypothetical protein VHZ95_16785 [Polyangiales bacterium]|nr:hypothetical protein [Polyangiales bacterium]
MWAPRRGAPTFLVRAALGLVVALSIAMPRTAAAKRETTFSYPYDRVWNATVRLMRVDFECVITEKDKDDGYFLFEYPDRGKTFPGSAELVAIKVDDVEQVRVVIQVPAMPSYVEGMMLDRLAKKLEQEFGAPKEPKHAPDSPNDPDKPKPDPSNKPKTSPEKP